MNKGFTRRTIFVANSGMLGTTEPNQKINKNNIYRLPPGSVVRNGDGSRLIHLHDELWLWCCDGAWCYDRIENLLHYLIKPQLCHLSSTVYE